MNNTTTMNNTTGCVINHVAKEIIITKKFNKAAGIYGSDEYNTMKALREDFADYSIRIRTIEKKENKVAYKGLNIKEMERFIVANRSEEEKALFDKILELQEGNKSKYAVVKKWFLDKYKDIYTTELQEILNTKEEAAENNEAA